MGGSSTRAQEVLPVEGNTFKKTEFFSPSSCQMPVTLNKGVRPEEYLSHLSVPEFGCLDLVQGYYICCGFLSSVTMSYLEDSIALHFSPSSDPYVLATTSFETYLEPWDLGDAVDKDPM